MGTCNNLPQLFYACLVGIAHRSR
uniref:Uncharacterized protein n=1 Tax=Triticum urartu TaxID=4572 RepID=A0A8R7UK65_TRIUA